MPIFYSASQRGFFDPAVHDPLPTDAVRLTAQRHAELLAGQEKGAQIVPGKAGRPNLLWPDRRAWLLARVKREAMRRIDVISPPWRQMNDMREPSEAGAARFAAIDAVRAASDEIEAEVAALPAKALDGLDVRQHPRWIER